MVKSMEFAVKFRSASAFTFFFSFAIILIALKQLQVLLRISLVATLGLDLLAEQ